MYIILFTPLGCTTRSSFINLDLFYLNVSLTKTDSFNNNSDPTRLAPWIVGDIVMGVCSHVALASMPFDLANLSNMRWEDQGSMCAITFQYGFCFSFKSNTCWAWVGKINGLCAHHIV